MWSQFNGKSQPCIFSPGLRFVFQLKCMQKTRWCFLQSAVEHAKQKKPFVFPNSETSEASCSRLFFACVFTRKRSAKQQKKIQGCDFLLNWRPHAKLQLIWTKKKNRPKFDIEWLCSGVFSWNSSDCWNRHKRCLAWLLWLYFIY